MLRIGLLIAIWPRDRDASAFARVERERSIVEASEGTNVYTTTAVTATVAMAAMPRSVHDGSTRSAGSERKILSAASAAPTHASRSAGSRLQGNRSALADEELLR